LVAVGDDQQSIYGFRGAQPSLMRRHQDNGAETCPLSINWRSGQAILDHANLYLDSAQDRLFEGRMVAGIERETTRRGAGYADSMDEARAVVDDIEASLAAGQPAEQIAVLYRLNALSGAIELELLKRGVAYNIAGSGFFGRAEIRTIIAYLAAALDEGDEDAMRRIYCAPLKGLGRAFLAQARSISGVRALQAEGGLGRWRRGALKLLSAVDGVRAALDESLTAALDYIIDDLGVSEMYRDAGAGDEDETETDIAFGALCECASGMDDASALVGFARTMTSRGGDADDTTGKVVLSSIHKAKGMEWDTVHVIGMTRGVLPFRRGDEAEELRLGYVAVTRARSTLSVSWCATTNGQPAGASSLAELGGFVALAHAASEPSSEGAAA
jgi:DNA helicase-2/ATP-dependent DNA helicase PcrA